MGFHKYGVFSFTIDVRRMRLIEGDSFVADVVGLRRHASNGTAERLVVPRIVEQYGETAREAEARAIKAMNEWLTGSIASAGSAAQAEAGA